MSKTSNETPILSATGVSKNYEDIHALDHVTLSMDRGECVALVGESGSGKTTLLRCFNRLVIPDSGEMTYRNKPLSTLDPIELRREVGYVQQDGGLLPHWTVSRNTSLVPWLRHQEDLKERADEALVRVGLPPEIFGHRYPRTLSGGQRQRVAIARALAASPEVVLLDEPFGALDAITKADLHEMFEILQKNNSLTVLLVTHDLQEAVRLADRIAVMQNGKIEQIATPETLMKSPETPYVAKLLQRSRVKIR